MGWVLNTPTRGGDASRLGFKLRRRALERRIPCLTSLDTAAAVLRVFIQAEEREPSVVPLSGSPSS